MANYGLTMDYDIPSLRRRQLFSNYGMPDPGDMDFGGEEDSFSQPLSNIQGGSRGVSPGPFSPQTFEPPPPDYSTPIDIGGGVPLPSRKPDVIDPMARQKEIMDQFYNERTAASDRFNELLNAPPEREAPGFARRLVASGMGLKAEKPQEAMEQVMYAPYLRDMAEWKAKGEAYEKAAQQENTSNINSRQLAGNMATNMFNYEKLREQSDLTRQKQEETERSNKAREQITASRNAVLASVAQGYTYKVVGNQLIGTTTDGKQFVAGKAEDYSPVELQRLENEGRLAVAKQQGANAVETKATVPGSMTAGAAPGNMTPKKFSEDMQDRMEALYFGASPMAKWLELGPGNKLKMKDPPGPAWLKSRAEEAAEMKEYLQAQAYVMGIDPTKVGAFVDAQTGAGAPASSHQQPPPTEASPQASEGLGPQKSKIGQLEEELRNPNLNTRQRQALQSRIQGEKAAEAYQAKRQDELSIQSLNPQTPKSPTGLQGISQQNLQTRRQNELNERIKAYLAERNLPLTQANIEHAIKTGRVK